MYIHVYNGGAAPSAIAHHVCINRLHDMLMPTNVVLHATDVGSVVDLLAGHQVLRVRRVCAWVALTEIIILVRCSHGVPGATEEGIDASLNSRRTFML